MRKKLVHKTVFYLKHVETQAPELTDVAGRAAPARRTLALVALTGLGAAPTVGAGVGQAGVLGWSLLGEKREWREEE